MRTIALENRFYNQRYSQNRDKFYLGINAAPKNFIQPFNEFFIALSPDPTVDKKICILVLNFQFLKSDLILIELIFFFPQTSSVQTEQGDGGRGLTSVREKGCP